MGRTPLEKYNIAILAFHGSVRELDSAIEEALLRCDKGRPACGEAR